MEDVCKKNVQIRRNMCRVYHRQGGRRLCMLYAGKTSHVKRRLY
jgi:hypothetical protein